MTRRPTLELLTEWLTRLKDYMQGLHPRQKIELRFWEIDDDDMFFEALEYLPLHVCEEVLEDLSLLNEMPTGYRLAFPIFWIEDDYHVNGWTALSNAGEWLLPSAIVAYREIGMEPEAAALEAALGVIQRGENDYYDESTQAAYESVPNKFADDDAKNEYLFEFFRRNRKMFSFDSY